MHCKDCICRDCDKKSICDKLNKEELDSVIENIKNGKVTQFRNGSNSFLQIMISCNMQINFQILKEGIMEKFLCKNREELYKFLNEFDWSSKQETELSSIYFLIQYTNNIEPLYFMHYEDIWFESPCCLHSYPMNEDELEEYVREIYQESSFEKAFEFEKTIYKDGVHYEIDCPQVSPFLEENFEILDVFSETECIDWLLEKNK